jgi:hypothetical protein
LVLRKCDVDNTVWEKVVEWGVAELKRKKFFKSDIVQIGFWGCGLLHLEA